MSELLNRISRLPNTLKNPFKKPTKEEEAVKVLVSLSRLPQFRNSIDELGEVIAAVQSPARPKEEDRELGYKPEELARAAEVIEGRINSNLLPEEIGNKYLAELRAQQDLKLNRPASFSQNLGRAALDVGEGLAFGTVGLGGSYYLSPVSSSEEAIFRGGSLLMTSVVYTCWRNRRQRQKPK